MNFNYSRENASLLLKAIGSFLIVGVYILGFYHSCTKHKDEAYIENPFLTLYRGIEIFWHDDFADVNWDIRLSNDYECAVTLINQYSDEIKDIGVFNRNLEELIIRIKKYPIDKFEKIKEFIRLYIRYSYSLANDIFEVMNEYIKSGIYINKESIKTKEIKSKMAAYVSKELMDTLDTQIQAVFEIVKERLSIIEKEKLKETILQLQHYFDITKSKNIYIFKKIFNEDI